MVVPLVDVVVCLIYYWLLFLGCFVLWFVALFWLFWQQQVPKQNNTKTTFFLRVFCWLLVWCCRLFWCFFFEYCFVLILVLCFGCCCSCCSCCCCSCCCWCRCCWCCRLSFVVCCLLLLLLFVVVVVVVVVCCFVVLLFCLVKGTSTKKQNPLFYSVFFALLCLEAFGHRKANRPRANK